jgi:acyl carrier protein
MDTSFETQFQQVKDLIAKETKARPDKVQLHTRIEDDLGTTGDDAVELMEAFMEHFQVDMTGYEHQKHFGPEGGGCCLLFWWGWTRSPEQGFQPVTVEHLVQVAQEGRWFDPPRISKEP